MPTNDPYNDQEIVLRIANGDETAFRQLAYRYSGKLFFHALTFVKDWQRAEEMAQDILLHIWNKREKLSSVNDLDSYIYIVSKNFLLSFLRKKVQRFNAAELDEAAKITQSTASEYENKELRTLLERAINHLPEQKRQVFRMIHYEGFTQEQVAQTLGIAERTVRWNLVSAINGIKDFMQKYSAGGLYFFFYLLPLFF